MCAHTHTCVQVRLVTWNKTVNGANAGLLGVRLNYGFAAVTTG